MYKVLIVEDDPMVTMINEQYVKKNKNFELVGKCSDGLSALEFLEHNEVDLVIFLREPLSPKMHEPDVNNIVRLCDMHNIPLATNLATAELLIKSLDRGDLEWREMYK